MSHFAEDAVWDNVPMSPAKGKQAIREMTQGFMKDMSAFNVKILKSLHEANVVFDSRVDTITTKSGKKAEVPVAGMFELDEAGKIKVWRDYFDLATFFALFPGDCRNSQTRWRREMDLNRRDPSFRRYNEHLSEQNRRPRA